MIPRAKAMQAAELFKTLSEPIRLRVLHLLAHEEELCVCHFVEILELPQSTVSRHLTVLKNSGLVAARKEGLWHYYSMKNRKGLEKDLLDSLRPHWAKDELFQKDLTRLKEGVLCKPVQ